MNAKYQCEQNYLHIGLLTTVCSASHLNASLLDTPKLLLSPSLVFKVVQT